MEWLKVKALSSKRKEEISGKRWTISERSKFM
jgi:hypothetical protein